MSAGFVLHHFDPSVPGRGFFRIINIGLLQERQNWLILSLAVAVIGAVFAAVGWRKH
jgi:hypothetical protein